MRSLLLSIVYFITGTLFLFFNDREPFIAGFLLKAMIMILLMILYLQNINLAGKRGNIIFFAGLIFSWLGDLFLEVPGDFADMFIPGLVSFLLAHVMYIIVFFMAPGRNIIFGRKFYLLLPLLVYGSVLVLFLYDSLGAMRLPVIAYSVVILVMLAGALNRLEKTDRMSYWLIVAGAILFVLSDSAIAVNRFGHHFYGASTFIMITYIVAQYLIVSGYIRQERRLLP